MSQASPRSLTEQAYLTLRANILACRYPPGARLKIASLCEEVQASLGAVREALSRLASEGLVVSEPQRGFTVSLVSGDDLADLTKARVDVETMCLTRAIKNGGVDWEAEILSSLYRLSHLRADSGETTPRLSEDWAEAHARFHSALVSACDSQWLLRIRVVLFEQADRYRRLAASFVSTSRDVDAEHKALAEATIARDVRRARTLLAEHFLKTASAVGDVAAMLGNASIKRVSARGTRTRDAAPAPVGRT